MAQAGIRMRIDSGMGWSGATRKRLERLLTDKLNVCDGGGGRDDDLDAAIRLKTRAPPAAG